MALSNLTKVQTVGIGSNIEVVGVVTTGQFKSGTSNLHSTGVELTNLNVSGIATIGGNLSIGGTLTYEDVTNIDSIGIVTARAGVNVSGGQLDVGSNIKLGNAGVITATSFVGGLPITSGADNRIITASSASAIQGESNLTFDGTNLKLQGGKIYGEDNASNSLHLQSTSGNNNHSRIEIGTIQSSDNGGIHFYTAGSSAATRHMTLKGTSGNLGIGVDNPTTKLQITDTSATILRTEATANDGDALIQALGKDSSGNDRMIMMRTDAGADQYRIISSDTSYNLALCTGNAPRVLIAGNSAATSIGGANTFNALLTTQGDISGGLLMLKAAENTTRLFVSGNDSNGVEVNLYDDAGGQKGILGVSGTEFFIKAPNTNAPLKFYTHNGTSLAERMVLKSDGKVGMQVATPKSNLHIYGPGDIRVGSQYGGHASITQQVSYSSGYTGVHWMFETNDQMSWSFDGVMIVHGTGGSSYGTEVTHIKLIYSRESGALNSGDTWRNGSSDYNIETLGHGQVGLNPSAGSFSTTEQTDPDGTGSTRSLFKLSWSASGQSVGVWSKLIGNFYWAAAGGGSVEIQDKDANIVFNSI